MAEPTKATAKINLARGTLIVESEFGAEGAAITSKGCPGFQVTLQNIVFSKIWMLYLYLTYSIIILKFQMI